MAITSDWNAPDHPSGFKSYWIFNATMFTPQTVRYTNSHKLLESNTDGSSCCWTIFQTMSKVKKAWNAWTLNAFNKSSSSSSSAFSSSAVTWSRSKSLQSTSSNVLKERALSGNGLISTQTLEGVEFKMNHLMILRWISRAMLEKHKPVNSNIIIMNLSSFSIFIFLCKELLCSISQNIIQLFLRNNKYFILFWQYWTGLLN